MATSNGEKSLFVSLGEMLINFVRTVSGCILAPGDAPTSEKKADHDPRYKLLIIGDGGTGKTTFVKRHLTGEFEKKYETTNWVKKHPLDFYTNYGKIGFTCWDTVGPEIIHDDISFQHYPDSHCAIIMFDVTQRLTYKNVAIWTTYLDGFSGNIPVVLCGNKVDLKDRQVQPREVTFHRLYKDIMRYYEISAKSNYNLEMPFLCLSRRLVGDPNLHFVESPAPAPPEVRTNIFDIFTRMKMAAKLAIAARQPLPDVDDDDHDAIFSIE